MVRPNYRDYRRLRLSEERNACLIHSAKGSTWEDHKYIKRVDGTYYYPDSYEGGRHLPEGDKGNETPPENLSLDSNDIEALAREVIRGNFGNGQERKDLLGDYYADIQKRVNEILSTSSGSKKVSEASSESVEKAETAAKNASNSNVHSGVDMKKVLSVYAKKSVEKNKKKE